MWSLLRSRRWVAFTALVIVAIVAFGFLSRWQWQRADEERSKREAWVAQEAAPPSTLEDAIAEPVEWQPVAVSGVFDPATTLLVRQRPLEGRNGFWVISALDTAQGRIWVNRGWIPATGAATGVVAAPSAPDGAVELTARIRLSPRSEGPPPTDLPDGQVSGLDPAAFGADVTGFYLEAVGSAPDDPGVVRLPAPAIDETQNVSYAVQWLIFATIAISGWFFFLRREAREDEAAERLREGT
jgi:cytochrome oxidase assembly protein ShyY1